ncbi:unnamed protein product [Arctia plantaginis]|uniref:CCHC-type domain-containing protein n=1 Tax=Arctia plantaginis TaxID=874455 RepID=A0A8S0Z8R8_ARCPL|nr:unnamed protein product [Arctia plantaginis]
MMNRKKLPNETMTKYYQDKISMCFRCDLSDAASVSCIIWGLPISLQSNARAFQCQRPDELYEAFLCALDDYRLPTFETREKFNKDAKQSSSLEKKVNPEIDPCPRCKKIGHILRNCPLPDQRTCYKCGVKGHIATRCSTSSIHTKPPADTNGNVKEIKLVQNYNEIYKKIVKVNGIFLKSYIDTGSQVNVINNRIVSVLQLNVRPTRTILKGFSGGLLTSRGEVDFDLEIDNIQFKMFENLWLEFKKFRG